MPSVSKAQQRYMAIAEHNPSALRGPMPKMTRQQLHDFASGSEKGKPEHVKKALHPALKERAGMVKDAHAHLSKAMPGFKAMHPTKQMALTQEHVRARKGQK